jgi:CBS domain-containing protein
VMDAGHVDHVKPSVSVIETVRTEKIRRVMGEPRVMVGPTTTVETAVAAMKEMGSSCAIVADESGVRGIFTERDYLDKIAGSLENLARPIADFMSAEPRTLRPDDTLEDLFGVIVEGGYRHLPVVEDDVCLGVVSAMDIVKYISDLFPAEVYNLPPNVDQVMSQVEGG